MTDPDKIRLPRIRLRPASMMRYGDEPLAAVAKAGGERLRLQHLGDEWVVRRCCHTHQPGRTIVDWIHPIGDMPREAAVAAFMALLAQTHLLSSVVVIAVQPTKRH